MSQLALVIIVIIIIILLNPNERGVITSIVLLLLALFFSNSGAMSQYTPWLDLNHIQEPVAMTKPLVNGGIRSLSCPDKAAVSVAANAAARTASNPNSYRGAIDCPDDGPSEIKDQYKPGQYRDTDEEADYDVKNVSQGLKRNDYVRSITGLIDQKHKIYERADLNEELADAEAERWEGNDDW